MAGKRKKKAKDKQRQLSILRDVLGIIALLLEIVLTVFKASD